MGCKTIVYSKTLYEKERERENLFRENKEDFEFGIDLVKISCLYVLTELIDNHRLLYRN